MIVLSLACVFMASLGHWQLNRAAEKSALLNHYQLSLHQQPKTLTTVIQNSALRQYTPIQSTGIFDWAHMILLDHQYHNHKLGYHVVVPFKADAQLDPVLVNLGWVEHGYDLSKLSRKTQPAHIAGHVYLVSPNPFITQPVPKSARNFPMIIQGLELKALSSTLGQHFQPFIVLLDAKAPFGFIRDWKPLLLSPSRHVFYAVQWFLFAALAFGIFLYLHTQRKTS
jgi:surfeit locus 1 family protein